MSRSGIHQITLPIPFPLQQVHVYLVEAGSGWIMVDAGFASPDAASQLSDAVTRLTGGWDHISGIVVTHFHPDHSGLAGWAQRRSGAPVYLHRKDFERLESMASFMDGDGRPGMDGGPYKALPRDARPEWERIRRERDEYTEPIEPTFLEGGDTLRVDGRAFEAIWTPGHTEGHLCLFDRAEDLLFTGDHLLARITPHIGMWVEGDTNPLLQFEESCRLIEALDPGYALPAHEADVEHPAERSAEIRAHHQHRRQAALEAIEGGARTAYGISRVVFARRTEPMQQFMALSETLAHLDALVVEGAVRRSPDEDPVYSLA